MPQDEGHALSHVLHVPRLSFWLETHKAEVLCLICPAQKICERHVFLECHMGDREGEIEDTYRVNPCHDVGVKWVKTMQDYKTGDFIKNIITWTSLN